MSVLARLADGVSVAALGVWLGTLAMSVAVAAIIFPAMRELDPSLGMFEAYGGGHADLGAGFVQARVFAAADIVQFAAASASMLGLIVSLAVRRNLASVLTMVRCVLLAGAALMLAYQLFVLAPRMDQNVRSYWLAAAEGREADAEAAQTEFLADHPGATRTALFIGCFVTTSLMVTAWAVCGSTPVRRGADGPER
jgi:hypothetical protein